MGDIADMMLDGTLDSQTGEYIGKAVGYPRTNQRSTKTKRNTKHAMEGQSVGGSHLVGKTVSILNHPDCVVVDCVGNRGKKRYILIDQLGHEHRVKFSNLIF